MAKSEEQARNPGLPGAFQGPTSSQGPGSKGGPPNLGDLFKPRKEEPAPQPQPEAVTPPPPPATYIVFFDFNKANLTAEAQGVVAEAANAYRSTGKVHVKVVGHTDTVGSSSYNQKLSERRAATVKAEMVRLGIGLYGVDPTEEPHRELIPVATLKTIISQIKQIAIGETIGYGRLIRDGGLRQRLQRKSRRISLRSLA